MSKHERNPFALPALLFGLLGAASFAFALTGAGHAGDLRSGLGFLVWMFAHGLALICGTLGLSQAMAGQDLRGGMASAVGLVLAFPTLYLFAF